MRNISLALLLLVSGLYAVVSCSHTTVGEQDATTITKSFPAPVLDVDSRTVKFEDHTYHFSNKSMWVPDVSGVLVLATMYEAGEYGSIMTLSKCKHCLPFSWLVIHDTTDVYADVNYMIFDNDCDGTFDTKYVGKETSAIIPMPECLHEEGGIYGFRQSS